MSHTNPTRPTHARHAFTLVELLVVIGVIALLISILLPALGKARSAAQTTSCLAQLRSLGQAVEIYRSEFQGSFPPIAQWNKGTANPDGTITWGTSYQGYNLWSLLRIRAGQLNAVCPTVRTNLPQPAVLSTVANARSWFSYRYNWFISGSEGGMSYRNRGVPFPKQISGATAGWSTPAPYRRVTNATEVMLFMDYPQYVAFQTNDLSGSDRGIQRLPAHSASVTGVVVDGETRTVFHQVAPVHGSIKPTSATLITGANVAQGSQGLINVAYCDGSVRTVPVKQGAFNNLLSVVPQIVLSDAGSAGALRAGGQAVLPGTRLMPYLAP